MSELEREVAGFSFEVHAEGVDISFSAGDDPMEESLEVQVVTALVTNVYAHTPGIREGIEQAVMEYGERVEDTDWALGFIEHLEHMGWHADNPDKDCGDEDGEDAAPTPNNNPSPAKSRQDTWKGGGPIPSVRPLSFERLFKAGLD